MRRISMVDSFVVCVARGRGEGERDEEVDDVDDDMLCVWYCTKVPS